MEKVKNQREAISKLDHNFEWIACEICGSEEHHLVATRTDRFLGGNTLFCMHECENCATVYQFPRPKQAKMGDYYPQSINNIQKTFLKKNGINACHEFMAYESALGLLPNICRVEQF